ncbi:MAG: glycosyltransferase family 4 protein [Clostridiales bacterium]|nr:glycosyltransferase family 4 protein [Clostridiales bacterium]
MNEFIKLRKTLIQDGESTTFSLRFLETYMKHDKVHNIKDISLLKSVERILNLSMKSIPSQSELINAMMSLGENDYLDKIIVDFFIYNRNQISKKIFEQEILKFMTTKTINKAAMFSLIDICIECDINVFKNYDLTVLFSIHKNDYDIVSILIDYMYHFKINGYQDFLFNCMNMDLPDNIKIQILSLLADVYSKDLLSQEPIIAFVKRKKIFEDFVKIFENKIEFNKKGLVLIQSMFQGEFDNDGKGNNGGIAVLLKSLGNALSKDEKVSMVISISINNEWSNDKPMIYSYSDNHLSIRMPIYINDSIADPFVKKEHFIMRFFKRFFERTQINPDIFHIRYLDNASKAIALLSERLGKKLVFTLTPDPHRSMSDERGRLKNFDQLECLSRLNRISIGDELIFKSDGILGIGKAQVKKELEEYFPQLMDTVIASKFSMIDEAIESTPVSPDDYDEDYCNEKIMTFGIPEAFFENPVILNVGRLNQMKGQDNLIKAWGNSRFSNDYRLLIIGGNKDNPNEEEKRMMDTFEHYLKANPYLRNRFCHIGALSNNEIRIIEKKIMSKSYNIPNIYLCSSQKEEFGIAILEALSEGYLVIAPLNGGVKSYIKQGINGFLINTKSWSSIANESEKIIYKSDITKKRFCKIQENGKETVLNHYTMDKVSQEMLTFYLSLEGSKR